jgi:DNA-binding MarR family transcriptional regulator
MTIQPLPLTKLARQIFVYTTLVAKLAGRDNEQRIAAQLPSISGLQFGVMQVLRQGPLTLSDLAVKMMLAPATLVPVVQRLEQDQLIARGCDPEDRRRRPLTLTASGREMLDGMTPYDEQDLITRSLRAMGETKARQLEELLGELLEHLAPEQAYAQQVRESLDQQENW